MQVDEQIDPKEIQDERSLDQQSQEESHDEYQDTPQGASRTLKHRRAKQMRSSAKKEVAIEDSEDDDDLLGKRGRKENGLVELTKKFISLLK